MDHLAEPIHAAALDLLHDPGVSIEHDGIRKQLLAAGCRPGSASDAVRVPSELVREALDLCPREVSFADRVGVMTPLGARSGPLIWSVPGLYIDAPDGHRLFTSADMAAVTRLLDRLENVHGVFGFSLDDVPPTARDVVGLRIMAENTSKHIRVLCFTPAGAEVLVEMKDVIGDYPWFSIGFTAHGPLRWTNLALEIFQRTAGHGIPVTVNGEPMAGVSGPVTLAGSASVGTAEILAGIVVNQLLEPGRPCVFNLGLAHVLDMRTAIAVTGGPENALFAALSAALGRFYELPSASWVSTESMCPDSQAALEKMFGFHSHMEAGVSLIWGVGQLESELTFSASQAVIDDEMISYARRYLRGVDVSESTLATQLVRDVGIAGSFLETEHTLENFREELFHPELLFRETREAWHAGGRQTLAERATARAAELMDAPVQQPLAEDRVVALQKLVDAYLARVHNDTR